MNEPIASLNWISEHLKIIDKKSSLRSLEPNIGQLMLHRVINKQRLAGFPVRILLLKPRQVGWSTWSEAEGFFEVNTKPNRTALVVSADTQSTDLVFTMTKLFQDEIPQHLRLPTTASSRKEIIYAPPHRSRFITQTAGKDVLGRGGTIHFFHASEVAFWPKAKFGLASVLQMVPNTVDTTVILETTANGMGGTFYDMFWQAVGRQRRDKTYSGYVPVFFPWYKFPEYTIKGEIEPTEEEEKIKSDFSITNGQILWRRLKIEELGGDVSMFQQEYPATALEAFVTSGNPVFTETMLSKQSKLVEEPQYCQFAVEPEHVNRKLNCWQIIEMPIPGREYAMGIDAMEGKPADSDDTKSPLDYHAAAILNRVSGKYVAIYHGKGEQGELADQCYDAAKFYNNAFVAPELPHGMVVLDKFRRHDYPNIYNRQVHDEQALVEDGDNLGWKTTTVTRGWLVDSFIQALREKSIFVGFNSLLDEMRTFIRDKTGKPTHMPGAHDDILIAAMIALQVHLRCPLDSKPYPYEHTGDKVEKVENRKTSLSFVGAIDTDEGEEDYEDSYSHTY